MSRTFSGFSSLKHTIKDLRVCSGLHDELIARFEVYQKTMTGAEQPDDHLRAGIQDGYSAELGYLMRRRATLDALIACVERYDQLQASSRSFSER